MTVRVHNITELVAPVESPLTQLQTTTTILVASSGIQFGFGTVNYNSGSVNPGSFGTWYIYADDPAHAGGAVPYLATTRGSEVIRNGRIYFGKITTSATGKAKHPERGDAEVAKRRKLSRHHRNTPAVELCRIFDREHVPLTRTLQEAGYTTWIEPYRDSRRPKYRKSIDTIISKDRKA